jgi:sulfite reductase (NADPH) flavoprotein alpha-component
MDWTTGIKRGPFTEKQTNQLIELLPGLQAGQVQWLSGYLTAIGPTPETEFPAADTGSVVQQPVISAAGPIHILYGTHTGNSERLALESAKRIAALGREAKVFDMGSFKTRDLKQVNELLVIVSTDGEGDPPIQAEELLEYLKHGKAPELKQMHYGVLALGDSAYTQFCQTGKDFDEALEKLGAKRMVDRIDCDVDFDDDYARWIEEVLARLGRLSVGNNGMLIGHPRNEAPQPALPVSYNRKHPFPATILKKINLNGRYSTKETIHLELDLSGSGLRYEPGDALGIYAPNSKRLMVPILETLGFSGEEMVESHKGIKTLSDALTMDYELTPLTGVSLNRYAELTGSKRLKEITADNALVTGYLYGRDILDLIMEEPFRMTPDVFLSLLRKNTPRMSSVASSQDMVDDEVHVLVSVVRYEAYGRAREGQCSTFLADRIQENDQVEVFLDPNTRFKLPADSHRPIIMVGPGTGIAPYRAFMQQREVMENRGKAWLFFGERNFTTDFLYQTEWIRHLKEGTLTKADVAFSRDQEQKVYVQDRMLEHGRELFDWLEEGAYFYLCGDKGHMAKDVDRTLRKIIREYGGMTEEKAGEYVKQLQTSDRYQTDVY